MSIITIIFILLILFQIKHFVADYPLQTPYMLRKFMPKGWVIPLACHTGVHAFFTSIIVFSFTRNVELTIVSAVLDFTIHFIMDRLKASPNYLGRFKALSGREYADMSNELNDIKAFATIDTEIDVNHEMEVTYIEKRFKHNKYFWYSLGLDQAVHHLTHYAIIYLMLGGM